MLRQRERARTAAREATLRYEIRPARQADLEGLEWFGEYRDLRLVEAAAWPHVSEGSILFFVADVSGFPVGQVKIALVHEHREKADGTRSGYLYALRVFRPFQRLGIGTALIRHAEDALCARGFRLATIAVERSNEGARRLYERLGYGPVREEHRSWTYDTPEGRRRRIEVDELLLRKELACD